ncbi:MAG: methylenetetrahydrofolate reductase [Bdellovibrionota bacterium]
MTIPEILQDNQHRFSFSVEITPPARGKSIDTIFSVIEDIREYDPKWIDVTSHCAGVEWVKSDQDETYQKRTYRKSPGTIAICAAIEHKFNVPTVPHLLCHGFTREETEDALIDLHYLGIKNVLAIRGDGTPKEPPIGRSRNSYALELVQQISKMNRGQYLYQEAEESHFCVGVACYPEKHFEAPNVAFDMEHLRKKQESGAGYCLTQMFFDNKKFFAFAKQAQKNIHIPIIPALKIFSRKEQLVSISKNFHVEIPQALVKRVEKYSSPEDIQKVGIEWAHMQCQELIEHGYSHIHFYIMKQTQSLIGVLNLLDQSTQKSSWSSGDFASKTHTAGLS